MTITLTGTNSLLLRQELDKLMASFGHEHGDLALERLDGEEVELDRISQALSSLPFLASKKMVVLRQPSNQKLFEQKVEQLLGSVAETTDVIIMEPKLDKRSGYYKFLKAKTDFREFNELDLPALTQWLVKLADKEGWSLNMNTARYLVERLGADQQLLAQELEKLGLYASSYAGNGPNNAKPQISRTTIDLLTEASPQSSVFELLEAAFAGDRQRTMELYKEQRALKVEPPRIIAMLTWQLHIVGIIKSAGDRSSDTIAKEAKLNPYVVRKSQNIASRLSLAQLKTLLADLLLIDARSKREPIDPDEALQHYLLSLAS